MRTCLILCVAASLARAAAPPLPREPPGKQADRIARFIEQLGDDEFTRREAATRQLKEIGEPAIDALRKAMASADLEVRRRAREIVTFLERKLSKELLRLTGHTNEVFCVCISSDGKRILTSSADRTLRLWDASTGKTLHVFTGHTERVVSASLSADGKRVLSGSDDRTVRVWDATTGKELDKLTGHAGAVYSVAFGPKEHALSGSGDLTMHRWDLKTGRNAGVYTGHGILVRSVAYSAGARLAATGSNDLAIRLWDLDTGKVVRTLGAPGGNADLNVCFSPDGKRIASNHLFDNAVRIWDVQTGKELRRFPVPTAYCVAFSADGKRIVTGGYPESIVRVWDVETGKVLRSYEGHTKHVLSVTFFPDGKRIASASGDGTVRIWGVPR